MSWKAQIELQLLWEYCEFSAWVGPVVSSELMLQIAQPSASLARDILIPQLIVRVCDSSRWRYITVITDKFSLECRQARLVCTVLVNSDILAANYGVKQRQFTKPTSEPCASDAKESNEAFDRAIRGWYCSITIANYRLITVIRFVVKNYTYP